MEENLSQETTSLADRDVILGALVPESHVVDAATGKSSDQPTEADQAGNLNDRDSASLLNADAQNHPKKKKRVNGRTYEYVTGYSQVERYGTVCTV